MTYSLDDCLDRFVPEDPDDGDTWCTRAHDHVGNHRGLRRGLIIEWDGLGYFVRSSPAPDGLER